MKFLLTLTLIAVFGPAISHSKDLKAYGADCEIIGFKPKTPAYGKCILELSREDLNRPTAEVQQSPVTVTPPDLPVGYVSSQTLGTVGAIIGRRDTTSRLDGEGTLIWSQNNSTVAPLGRANFSAAVAACAAMNASGALGYSSGWRLPSQPELSGLNNSGMMTKLILASWTFDSTWTSTQHSSWGHYTGYFAFADLDSDSGRRYVSCVHENF